MRRPTAKAMEPYSLRLVWTSFLALVLAALLLSCTKSADEKPAPVKGGGVEASPSATGESRVELMPVSPEAAMPIRAVFLSGGGQAREAEYAWTVNDEPLEAASDVLAPGPYKRGDEVTVTVAADGGEYTDTITVANSAPRVTGVRFMPENIYAGVDMTAEVEGVDDDGDDIRYGYQWMINGTALLAETGEHLAGDLFKRGDRVTVTVEPTDGLDTGESFTPEAVTIPNGPPEFTTTPPHDFRARTYTYSARAVDPDNDAVSYRLVKAPDGMSVSADGDIEWTISGAEPGAVEISIEASDGAGGAATQDYTLNISLRDEK